MNEKKKKFLDGVYGLDDPEATEALYRDWAGSYDDEVAENGYLTPIRCATALARYVADKAQPLLDLGCGTGLSGAAFRAAGFPIIDGLDFSSEMLTLASQKAGVYRRLIQGDLTQPLPTPNSYANFAAVGVFSPGHAPAELIDRVVSALPQGGCFVFSLNDHALEEKAYQERIEQLVEGEVADKVFWEYGEHLPQRGLMAVVGVLRRR